jgi:hypothetical protein
MQKKDDKDYKVGFAGATISKIEANRIGLSLFISICLVLLLNFIVDIENKYIIFAICLGSVFLSYFAISKRMFKNKSE